MVVQLEMFPEETKDSFGFCRKCGAREKEVYTFRDYGYSNIYELEFESEEEAIHHLVSYFPISVVNAEPPTLGWAWKAVIAEKRVNYDG